MENNGLGRIEPQDFEHVDKYPLKAISIPVPRVIEKSMILPSWHRTHDQGQEGACVGFNVSMGATITNIDQALRAKKPNPNVHYNPWWLWDQAKIVDQFPETNPGDSNGTTVRAAYDILKTKGHVIWQDTRRRDSFTAPRIDDGISTYRWATSIDDVRAAIGSSLAVAIGVNWYSNFDTPVYKDGEYWIGLDSKRLGKIRGGHCVCIYGCSDHRQAVRIKNSWGKNYPEVWMPYSTLSRLLRENGEIGVITDR